MGRYLRISGKINLVLDRDYLYTGLLSIDKYDKLASRGLARIA
jgi:hypothetical protein